MSTHGATPFARLLASRGPGSNSERYITGPGSLARFLRAVRFRGGFHSTAEAARAGDVALAVGNQVLGWQVAGKRGSAVVSTFFSDWPSAASSLAAG